MFQKDLAAWNVARNAPRLIHRQHIGDVGIGFCLAPVNVSERLAASIEHLEAARYLLNGPWRAARARIDYILVA
jgi:hypothetical protein